MERNMITAILIASLAGILAGTGGTLLLTRGHDDAPAEVVAATAGVVEAVVAPAVVEAETAQILAAPDVAVLVCAPAVAPGADPKVQAICLYQLCLRAVEGDETGAGLGCRELGVAATAAIVAGQKPATVLP